MITETQNKTVSKSGDFRSKACGIKQENMRYIASLLRNNYSDPLLAIIREYVCNAVDETPAGKKTLITMPTKLASTFMVRDFGKGLDEETMFELFTSYGESTKRNTNEKIGSFGIGRLCALSYGDQFMIESYHGGMKTVYTMLVDEEGDTDLDKLFEEKSDEPTGLCIQVAIKANDIHNFENTMHKFFYYMKDKIEFTNFEVSLEYDNEKELTISNDLFDLWNGTHRYHFSNVYKNPFKGKVQLLMGGVLYPINTNQLNDHPFWKSVRNSNNGFVWKAPMGSVKLHHSRESLEYNERTKEALKNAGDQIIQNFKSHFEVKVAAAKKSLFDATVVMDDLQATYSWLPKEARTISAPKHFGQGVDVSMSLFNPTHFNRESSLELTLSRNGSKVIARKLRYMSDGTMRPSQHNYFVIDDGVTPRSPVGRLSHLIDGRNGVSVVVLSPKTLDEKVVMKRFALMNSDKVSLLSSHARPVPVRSTRSNLAKSHLTGADIMSLCSASSYERDCWTVTDESEIEDDTKKYYYVAYFANKVRSAHDRNKSILNFGESPDIFWHEYQRFIKACPSWQQDKVYGVRSNQLSKVKKLKNWIPLEDVLVSEMAKSEILNESVKHRFLDDKFPHAFELRRLGGAQKTLEIFKNASARRKDCKVLPVVIRFIEEYLKLEKSGYNPLDSYAKLKQADCAKLYKEELKALDTINAKYPLFSFMLQGGIPHVNTWSNAADKQRQKDCFAEIENYLVAWG